MEATCNYICMLKRLLEKTEKEKKQTQQEEIESGFQTSNAAGKLGQSASVKQGGGGVILKVRRAFQNYNKQSYSTMNSTVREICTPPSNNPILTSSAWARKDNHKAVVSVNYTRRSMRFLTSGQTTRMHRNTNFSTCMFTKPSRTVRSLTGEKKKQVDTIWGSEILLTTQ